MRTMRLAPKALAASQRVEVEEQETVRRILKAGFPVT